jgi:septal ring factor EnvC (AmiA/AmiB activator)
MLDKMDLPEQTEDHRRRRYVVLGLCIIALAAAIYFGPALREHEPDYYDPARAALIKAERQFEESLVHEEVMIDQLKMAHEELDSAIAQLAKVADLDPVHRSRIESLRKSLQSIERKNSADPGETNPEKLQQDYRDLLAQIGALIKDIDDRRR